MRRIIIILLFVVGTIYLKAEDNTTHFKVSLSEDAEFGLVPAAKICYKLDDNLKLLFYATLWDKKQVDDTLGSISYSPEFGAGISFKLFDDYLAVAPFIGIGNGNYHSGGGRDVVLDYIAANLILNGKISDKISFEAQFNNRLHARNVAYIRPKINEYQWQVNPEFMIAQKQKLGIYIDQYIIDKIYWASSITYTEHFWVGLSYKIQSTKGSLWFSTGVDMVDYFDNGVASSAKSLKDYYKILINIDL